MRRTLIQELTLNEMRRTETRSAEGEIRHPASLSDLEHHLLASEEAGEIAELIKVNLGMKTKHPLSGDPYSIKRAMRAELVQLLSIVTFWLEGSDDER